MTKPSSVLVRRSEDRSSSLRRGGPRRLTQTRGQPWAQFILFLSPVLVLLVITRVVPLLSAVASSFGFGADQEFFAVYQDLFSSSNFWNSVRVTLWFNLIINPAQIILALALAVLLSQKLPGTGIWRMLVFLPVAIPQAASTIVWGLAFRPDDGLANSFLQAIGMSPQPWVTSSDQALYSIMILASWIGVGFWMVFLIAGLQNIPRSYLEAAAVDGAGWWQAFFRIKLPQLARPLTFVLVADTVANFLLFVPVQVLTNGGPAGSTNVLMFEVYRQAFTFADSEYASAHVLVLTLIMLAIVSFQFRLLQRLE